LTQKRLNLIKILEKKEKKKIMPVVRATSFDKKTKEGHSFIYSEHTAETNIYYALDLGKSYRLIDESMLKTLNMTEQQIKEVSLFNVRKLKNKYSTDEVKGNIFYFINDGLIYTQKTSPINIHNC